MLADLNPMENIWAVMVRKVYGDNQTYNNTTELKLAVYEASETLSLELATDLINSMKKRYKISKQTIWLLIVFKFNHFH